MNTTRQAIGIIALCGVLATLACPSEVLAGETIPTDAAPISSSFARASAMATIVERPDFTCDRILRAASVEIVTFPRLTDDHRHPGEVPRLNCTYLMGALSVSVMMAPVETASRQLSGGASVFDVPAAGKSAPQPTAGPKPGHSHVIEVIYNFE